MRAIALAVLFTVGCSAAETTPIEPDPSGPGGSGGVGGTGGTAGSSSSTGDGGSAGSGGSAPQGGLYESGSRLRARHLIGTDGTKQFLGWFDAQRSEQCAFVAAGDGKQRCLPLGSAVILYFKDPSCSATMRIASVNGDVCNQGSIDTAHIADTSCPPRHRIFFTGAKITPATIYVLSEGACTAIPAPSNHTFLDVLGEVDAGMFVGAEEMTE